MVLTQRSANAFALGERTGVLIASMPIEAKTPSKLAVNLVSRSRMRNRNAPARLLEVARQVAGDLGHPRPVGVGGDAEEVDDASVEFDHEQDVVAPQQHGVDGEEVGRHDALRLGAEELGPGRARIAAVRVGGHDGAGRWRRLPFDTAMPSFFSSPTMRR